MTNRKKGIIGHSMPGASLSGASLSPAMLAQIEERAKGQKEIVEEFGKQRAAAYREELCEALRKLDLEAFKKFSLRWGIVPRMEVLPIRDGLGRLNIWQAHHTNIVMHTLRVRMADTFSLEERKHSAKWLLENSIELPPGISYDPEKDELSGNLLKPS